MLKKTALVLALLLLGALSAAAQSPCNTGDDLSWLSAPVPAPEPAAPAAGDDLAWLFAPVDPAASTVALASTRSKPNKPNKPSGMAKAFCSEDCDALPDISCSGSVCNAVSRDCAFGACVRGSVTCDGVTTYCSQACPPNCTPMECRAPCKQIGCVALCLDTCTCECETYCG